MTSNSRPLPILSNSDLKGEDLTVRLAGNTYDEAVTEGRVYHHAGLANNWLASPPALLVATYTGEIYGYQTPSDTLLNKIRKAISIISEEYLAISFF